MTKSRYRRLLLTSLSWYLVVAGWSWTAARAAEIHGCEVFRFDHLDGPVAFREAMITAIAQDRFGFLWVGTNDGMYRYDGYQVVTYRNRAQDPASLPSNRINDLMLDRQGVLWVALREGGLCRYDPDRDGFVPEPLAEGASKDQPMAAITCLAEDPSGELWLGLRSKTGAARWDPVSGRLTRFEADTAHPDAVVPAYVTSILVDRQERVWFATRASGLLRYLPESGHFQHITSGADNPGSLPSDTLQAITQDSAGRIWIASAGGLSLMDPETNRFTTWRHNPLDPTSLPSDHASDVAEDSLGGLWVCTDKGLALFDPGSGGFTNQYHHPRERDSLASDLLSHLFVDRTGVLWIGSDQGLHRHDPSTRIFENYREDAAFPDRLAADDFWGVAEARDGAIWLATNGGGVTRYHPAKGEWRTWRHDPGNTASLASDTIFSIMIDRQDRVWVGTAESGLDRYDPVLDAWIHSRHDEKRPDSLYNDAIYCLAPSHDGTIWVGTNQGMDRLDPETMKFSHPQVIEGDPDGGLFASIFSLVEDRHRHLWIGTFLNGLRCYEPETDRWLRYDRGEAPGSLGSNRINTLLEDRDGAIWVGTSLGLYRLRADVSFQSFRESQGLAGDTVLALAQDESGDIWVGTTNGLSRLNPISEEIRNFGSVDGLPHDSISWHALLPTSSGDLVIGTSNGFSILNPKAVTRDSLAPVPAVIDMQLFNTAVGIRDPDHPPTDGTFTLTRSILVTDALTLSHRESVFSFTFTGFHFADPDRNRYAYQLDGWDEHWLYTDAGRRHATYTNIPEGGYRLRLKAANKDGVWSEPVDALSLRILPPPWRTWWAYGLYAVAILGALFWAAWSLHRKTLLARARAAREREVNRRLRRLDKLKDEFLANTSHELRTPLNGIVGLAESLIDGATGRLNPSTRGNLAMIVSSGRRLTNLVNDILDFSKLRDHSLTLQAKPVDVRTMVDVVLMLSQPLLAGKAIRLVNEVAEDLPTVRADENRLHQILHNLLGNAIKFTESGSIRVSAECAGDVVAIAVTDTGIGIPKEAQARIFASFEQGSGDIERLYGGTGLGLAITKKLVDLHGGSIRVSSEPGAGATFTFTLPVAGQAAEPSLGVPVSRLSAPELTGIAAEDAPAGEGERAADREPPLSSPSAATSHIAGKGFRIMIVDDEPINRQVLVNHLKPQDYQIIEAVDGAEALAKFAEQRPDLVLLDIMMPRISGYEVCRRFRREAAPSDLPVLFLSARNQVGDLVTGYQSGANDYLTKPISKPELLARVKTQLELLEITRDLEARVQARTAEVAQRNRQLAERNQQIQAGIDYARLIQESVLPSPEVMTELLKDYFVHFRPRESVSGDFFWLHRHPSGALLIAVVDCTGHGVPGAFMSMIGSLLLDQIVIQEGHDDPADILNHLHEEVRKALHQDREDGAANDGMDMVLCRLDPDGSVLFAGARNDLLYWSRKANGGGGVQRERGDRRGIGGRRQRQPDFKNRDIPVAAGDMLYLMTDGLMDQVGADGRRLGRARLMELIAEVAAEPLDRQQRRFATILDTMLAHQKQRDDVTMLGIRVPSR